MKMEAAGEKEEEVFWDEDDTAVKTLGMMELGNPVFFILISSSKLTQIYALQDPRRTRCRRQGQILGRVSGKN